MTNIEMIERLEHGGGRVLLVGGAVRDRVLGLPAKDLDYEVYGLSAEAVTRILSEFGTVQAVGSSFGVLKVKVDGQDYDFSLPRRENKEGRGHKGFQVEVDPTMMPSEAASRRDFTINALTIEMATGKVLDWHGGVQDLEDGRLRATSEQFGEDPLRVLRGMQFAGRFSLRMDDKTARMSRSLIDEFDTLSIERIWIEFEKWAEKSEKPSLGIRVLEDTNWVSLFPELEAIMGCPQNPVFHPEGNVLEHTKLVVDEMATLAADRDIKGRRRVVLMLAALCHDLGKPETTTGDTDTITSIGHEAASATGTNSFLHSIGAPKSIIDEVVSLVSEHMTRLAEEITRRAIRRLAVRLSPSIIEDLVLLITADGLGRGNNLGRMSETARRIRVFAEDMEIADAAPKPILMGRHLIELGMEPGPFMGEVLRHAFEAQLEGEFYDMENATLWAISHIGGGRMVSDDQQEA